MKKNIIYLLSVMACLFFLLAGKKTAYAAAYEFENEENGSDISIMAMGDEEAVDVTFISPIGQKFSLETGIDCIGNESFRIYYIKNADKGTWKAEYDEGNNSKVDFYTDTAGEFAINDFNYEQSWDGYLRFTFETEYAENEAFYYYICAVSEGSTDAIVLHESSSNTNGEVTAEPYIGKLPSGQYEFVVIALLNDEENTILRSVRNLTYDYTNPNEPDEIDNFKIYIDAEKNEVRINWSDFSSWSHEGYRMSVTADGEKIYSGEYDSGYREDTVKYPADSSKLEIGLTYKSYGLWAKEKAKTIDLKGDFLKNASGAVTGTSYVELQYSFSKNCILKVTVNGNTTESEVTGQGSFTADIDDGTNEIYVEAELEDYIYYVLNSQVSVDTNPPSIYLYDNLDGKSVAQDTITIIGKITDADLLKIDGVEVSFNENGTFSVDKSLEEGENVISIEAKDNSGNVSLRTVTLYKKVPGKVVIGDDNLKYLRYLPLLASILTSLLIIVIAYAFFRRKKSDAGKMGTVGYWVKWDIFLFIADAALIAMFVVRYLYTRSIKYIEMAEKSVVEAAKYVIAEKILGIAAIVGLGLFVIFIIITTVVGIVSKKKAQEE